jgi:hypothetical protein
MNNECFDENWLPRSVNACSKPGTQKDQSVLENMAKKEALYIRRILVTIKKKGAAQSIKNPRNKNKLPTVALSECFQVFYIFFFKNRQDPKKRRGQCSILFYTSCSSLLYSLSLARAKSRSCQHLFRRSRAQSWLRLPRGPCRTMGSGRRG